MPIGRVTAIVLAGGRGSRLVPRAAPNMKPLFEVDGAPLIQHAVQFAEAFDAAEVVIVTNPQNDGAIREAIGPRGVRVVQPEPRGVIDALLLGIGDHPPPYLVLCADNTFVPGGAWFRRMTRLVPREGTMGAVAVRKLADPDGRFTTFELRSLVPRRPDPGAAWRWVGPILLGGRVEPGGVEEALNAAGAPFLPVKMSCDDHGVAG